jgi:hypothetical protein
METPGNHQGERSEPERAERRVLHAGGPWPRAWWRGDGDQAAPEVGA